MSEDVDQRELFASGMEAARRIVGDRPGGERALAVVETRLRAWIASRCAPHAVSRGALEQIRGFVREQLGLIGIEELPSPLQGRVARLNARSLGHPNEPAGESGHAPRRKGP
jgi:hypothetical protein